ncbi:MAG: PAS domain-containing protein [Chitinophagales bacterium]|nr:PAS domain-containing protein [Chitinophagales bacterium]
MSVDVASVHSIEDLLTSSVDSLSLYDCEREQYLYVSPSTLATYGCSMEEFCKERDAWIAFVHDDDREMIRSTYDNWLLNGGLLEIEYRIGHKNGTKWISDRRKIVVDDNGKPLRLQSIATDITYRVEAKKLIKDLAKNLNDFKYALTQSTIVSITDKKGIITFANANFSAISGYELKDLIGKSHNVVNSGYHPPEFFRAMWATISKGKIWRGDIRNKSKLGQYYWVDTYIVPFLDEQHKPYQYLSIRSDITSRKEAELHLEEMNKQLEQMVADRTQELEQKNASLKDFVYFISHDLQAPLRHLNVYGSRLQTALGERLDEQEATYLRNMGNSVEKMSRLIDGLLQFSRLENQPLTFRWIDTGRMVHRIFEELKLDYPDKEISFNSDELPVVYADEMLLNQVFSNLISNALKYSSKKEEIIILIGCEQTDKHTLFSVKDYGVGFDDRYIHKLFGVFQRLHNVSEFAGTGIGLACARKIVERHGGSIWAESKLSEGATFYFTISNEPQNVA